MTDQPEPNLVSLDVDEPVWDRFFMVAPLVVVGTMDEDGRHDLAPKHLAMPMGWENFFGFVCTPRHRTYQNIRRTEVFTVSFPRPSQVVLTSLAAAPRCGDNTKPSAAALPTLPARVVDGVLLEDASAHLECRLDRFVHDFGSNSLIVGRVVAAHVDKETLRLNDRDEQDMLVQSPLLAYLPPGRYATIDRSYSFPFPAGFSR
jgi:flavin reductase (DIM6/NTAB) family NADH-FMN oxidoreductase RutF